jgi:thioredoxin 2
VIVACPQCGRKNRVPAAASGLPHCGNCHRILPWIADGDDDSFAEVVEESPLPVLVDLWAPWCGPCRMVSPALEELARELAGTVKLVKVNVDDSPEVANRFDARAIPLLLVLRGRDVVARRAGAAPLNVLRPWLEGALLSAGAPAPGG